MCVHLCVKSTIEKCKFIWPPTRIGWLVVHIQLEKKDRNVLNLMCENNLRKYFNNTTNFQFRLSFKKEKLFDDKLRLIHFTTFTIPENMPFL